MPFYADLHVHSKYSRATSRDCDLEHLALWARRKGLTVVATGDFTHPAWFDEIRDKLVPAEPGLFRLRPSIEREVERRLPTACRGPVRFLLEVEISTIYKLGERTRKVHHLVYAPDLETAGRFRDALGRIGNIASDGRPILGLDSRHLLEIVLESGPGAYLVPAHVWTPWFAVLGSKSGFDSVEECYGDLAPHIFAVETGLSSDPPMNWRVSSLDRFTLTSSSDAHSPPMLGREASVFSTDLDYFAIRRALETGDGYGGTVEFFPEEGKYHLDGHRACGVRLEPAETRRRDGLCPQCGKPLTVGTMHRVEVLADRPDGARPAGAAAFRSLVPLPEIVAEISGVGVRSKTVGQKVGELASRLGPELDILERLPIEDLRRAGDSLVSEAVERLRAGRVHRQAGYDGEYGTIHLFEPGELDARRRVAPLFGEPPTTPSSPWQKPLTVPSQPQSSSTERRPRGAEGNVLQEASPLPMASVEHRAQMHSAGIALDHELLPRAAPPPTEAPGLPTTSPILAALDPDQRQAAEVLAGPLLIVAGPGTGKTRTLTHRLAHLVTTGAAAPGECLAVTFTRRAAAEMKERLEALLPGRGKDLTVATFHGLGLEILRRERREVGLHRGFRVADRSVSLGLAEELFDLSSSKAARLLEELSRHRRQATTAGGLEDKLCRYRAALRERDLVDFDDLLALTVELLDARPDLRDAWRRRCRYLSIDEYQDVDLLQVRLVRLLAPPEANLCAIGDPDQSIYRFRGADVGFFQRFQEDYPQARRVHLGRNYRSSSVIVEAAVQAIAPASLVAGRELRAVTEGAAEPVVVHAAPSTAAEAEHVAHAIERLLGGTSHFSLDSGRVEGGEEAALSFDDIAVLYRTDAQSAAVIEALERAGIPYQKRSHDRLGERPGVRSILAALAGEAADGPGRQATLPGLTVPLAARLAAAVERAAAAEPEEEAAIAAAGDLLAPLAGDHGDDLEGFLAAVALGAEVDTWDPRAERVSLLTLHAAKGLEFPVVFLVGCADGLLPLRHAATEDEVDEERRLFFVGITRARSRLFLSYACRHRIGGEVREARPSRFLRDIDTSLLDRRRGVRRKRRSTGPRQLTLL